MLAELLSGYGYMAQPMTDQLALPQRTTPFLIVIDLSLPPERYESLLRRLARRNDLPVLLLSEQAVHGLPLPVPKACTVLTKPFHPQALLNAVRHLSRHRIGPRC